jgi:hypothetical protein
MQLPGADSEESRLGLELQLAVYHDEPSGFEHHPRQERDLVWPTDQSAHPEGCSSSTFQVRLMNKNTVVQALTRTVDKRYEC